MTTPIRRNKFRFNPYRLATMDMGGLYPIGLLPVLPNDVVGMNTSVFMRVSPLAAPVMHRCDIRVHHYYAANRILWDGWEDFWTGGEDGMNTDTIPQIATDGVAGGLMDHLGIPPGAGAGININAMPITMYNLIWNENYRDQDLQTERALDDLTIANICWEKDYRSTARPWSQKGPAISIPLGDRADVLGLGVGLTQTFPGDGTDLKQVGGATEPGNWTAAGAAIGVKGDGATSGDNPDIWVDLANAQGADPIDVRRAWGIQRFMENAARFGSRYPEKLRQLGSHYKGLLERPEFLGGSSSPLNFSEVLQTANDDAATEGVGDLYGHGIGGMRGNKFARRIDESGYIMTLLSVRPKTLYANGVDREWLKLDREDFHDPFLEEIGMQPVYNGELDLDHTTGTREVFGYSDRYQEYRDGPQSSVTSEFRDVFNYWHLGRELNDPTLDGSFVECTPSKRIFQEQTQNSLWCMAQHHVAVHRNLTKVARNELI